MGVSEGTSGLLLNLIIKSYLLNYILKLTVCIYIYIYIYIYIIIIIIIIYIFLIRQIRGSRGLMVRESDFNTMNPQLLPGGTAA